MKKLINGYWFPVSALFLLVAGGFVGCGFFDGNSKMMTEAGDMVSRRDFSLDPTKKFRAVPLRELMVRPAEYKSIDVVFQAVFHRYESVYVPFYTPYTPEDYVALSVWPGDVKLSDLQERKKDMPFVFVRKSNPYLKNFLNLEMYSAVEIKGTVMNDFHGYPWIEAMYIEVQSGPIYSKAMLHHLINGFELADKGNLEKASEHMQKAMSLNPPPSEAASVQRFLTRKDVAAAAVVHAETQRAKETEVSALQKTVEMQENTIRDLHAQIQVVAQLQSDLDKMKTDYTATMDQIQKLTVQIAAMNHAIQDREGRLAEREKTIETLNATLAARQAEMEKLAKEHGTSSSGEDTAMLQEKQKEIESLKADLQARHAEAEQNRKALEEARAHGGADEALKAQVTDLTGQLIQIKQERDEIMTQLSVIHQSVQKTGSNGNENKLLHEQVKALKVELEALLREKDQQFQR